MYTKKEKYLKMSGVVKLSLFHVATGASVMEKRYMPSQTIEQIKANIATHFQTPVAAMKLRLKKADGSVVDEDLKNEKMLGYYQVPADGWCIDVIDTRDKKDAEFLDFNDTSKVEKFQISEEAYAKREDNARAFRQRMEEQMKAQLAAEGVAPPPELHADSYKEDAAKMKVGDRCQVFPGDRLGTVRYVGQVPELKLGWWIGIQYDEPQGKNDGTAKGKRYFECPANYGGFVRPEQVTVGDFPPEEY